MIDPTKSSLYKQSSKKYLMQLLDIPNKQYLKQNYVVKQISPYIQPNPKPRLIEVPSKQLRRIQRNIKNELNKIIVPDNVFSGVKEKSYIDNAIVHQRNNYVFKIDLTAFFPCITHDTVYSFFIEDLKTSADIALILTNLLTVDLSLCDIKDAEAVESFLLAKKIRTTNHLISGSPASQILSYLVNHNMFDELQSLCDRNNITMSIYVDDITFSSHNTISHKIKEVIYNIISKNIYRLSRNKVKYYTKNYPKLITGAVIAPDGNLKVRNALSLNIMNEWNHYKNHPDDMQSYKRLRGLIVAAQQSDSTKFQNIYKAAHELNNQQSQLSQ